MTLDLVVEVDVARGAMVSIRVMIPPQRPGTHDAGNGLGQLLPAGSLDGELLRPAAVSR
jgi:hypothetical protein